MQADDIQIGSHYRVVAPGVINDEARVVARRPDGKFLVDGRDGDKDPMSYVVSAHQIFSFEEGDESYNAAILALPGTKTVPRLRRKSDEDFSYMETQLHELTFSRKIVWAMFIGMLVSSLLGTTSYVIWSLENGTSAVMMVFVCGMLLFLPTFWFFARTKVALQSLDYWENELNTRKIPVKELWTLARDYFILNKFYWNDDAWKNYFHTRAKYERFLEPEE